MTDAVAVVSSPYVPSQTQTQAWPGADAWSMTITLPKMNRAQAAPWQGLMAEMRGMSNVLQIGDPFGATPRGVVLGTPEVQSSAVDGGCNGVGATTLQTCGWTPDVTGQLLAGDYLQVVNRLYLVCENVNSDAGGNAAIPIWPSLRETPAGGAPLVTKNTVGVFRLAQNARSWHKDFGGLMSLSLKLSEVR